MTTGNNIPSELTKINFVDGPEGLRKVKKDYLASLADLIAEVHRFETKAKAWMQEANGSGIYVPSPSPTHAAAKRASLDLTRALAQFRKRRAP